MNITQYIQRKYTYQNTLGRITPDGKLKIIEDGKEYTEEEFRRKYPLPMNLIQKNNADKSKDWMQVK